MNTGIIFDIKRFAVHDGPGIRTTVFFKGCPLQCRWCHNPESWLLEPETVTRTDRLDKGEFPREETIGRKYTVDQIMEEIEKDRVFYEESGGGVTLSGGEPLMQPRFLLQLLRACRKQVIHTALDTCGYSQQETIAELSGLVDLSLFDIKVIDEEKHLALTGVSNSMILANLDLLVKNDEKVIIRYPVIPGYNDSVADLEALTAFLKPRKLTKINLLPYHNIADHKYRLLRKEKLFDNIKEPVKEQLENIRNYLEEEGFSVRIGG